MPERFDIDIPAEPRPLHWPPQPTPRRSLQSLEPKLSDPPPDDEKLADPLEHWVQP